MNVIFRTRTHHIDVYERCIIPDVDIFRHFTLRLSFRLLQDLNTATSVICLHASQSLERYRVEQNTCAILTHMKLSMDNLYWFPDSFLQNILSSSNPGAVHFVELYQRKRCLIIVKLFYIFISTFNCVSAQNLIMENDY